MIFYHSFLRHFGHKEGWLGVCLLLLASSAAIGQIQSIELNEGDQQEMMLTTGKKTTLRLLSLTEYTEPYFQSADSQLVDAVVRADVTLSVDGVTQTVQGGPFQLPVTINEVTMLQAQAYFTSA